MAYELYHFGRPLFTDVTSLAGKNVKSNVLTSVEENNIMTCASKVNYCTNEA
jgi:hypothetical protein